MAVFNITPTSLISDAAFIVDLLTMTKGQDTVAFFDQANPGNQIFVHARPLKVLVKPTNRVLKHPLETGQLVGDYKIVNPQEIDISVIISAKNYLRTYNEIKNYSVNSLLIGIATRIGYLTNFIIADMPHSETPEKFDSIVMDLRLEEVLFVPQPAPYAPAAAATAASAPGGGIAGVTAPVSANVAGNIQSTVASGQQTAMSVAAPSDYAVGKLGAF